MPFRLLRNKMVFLILLGIIVTVASDAAYRNGLLSKTDRWLQDSWVRWQGVRSEPTRVVIVAIDEETLNTYPDDPLVFWTDRLGAAMSKIRASGANVIGLDFLLSISPERWLEKMGGRLKDKARSYDEGLRQELNRGQIILVGTRYGDGSRDTDYLLPSPDYLLALPDMNIPAHVGLADLLDDGDGIVRQFKASPIEAANRKELGNDVPLWGFPALVANTAATSNPSGKSSSPAPITLEDPMRPIPYWGPPGTFKRISLRDILAASTDDKNVLAELRNKVVLIGATATGLNDAHFTPYSSGMFTGRAQLMAGVEIHANIIESLLKGKHITAPSNALRLVILLGITAIALTAFTASPPWLAAMLALISLPILWIGGYTAYLYDALAPISIFMLAIALSLMGVLSWRLTGEERQRAQLRHMFGRYVSEQVVEALLKSDRHPALGGQSQTITVLFSDIRNFTTLSERLEATEVVEMLNEYFARVCKPVLDEGGCIDKFIGDAIMVEFGSPAPVQDHASRAVRAALAMQKVAEDFGQWMQRRFPDRNLPPFAIGVGLHSGNAVIGNIGSPSRMEFTAIGDTVNLASRIEGITKELGCVVLASESTINLMTDPVVTGKTSVVKVKGRDAPVKVLEVLDIVRET